METQRFTLEQALYFLAICLALTLRLWALGGVPLSDAESNQALQALYLSESDQLEGLELISAPNPAYQALTAIGFRVFGDGDSIARIWPAIAGSLLVLAPIFFRPLIGRSPALLLSFLLAVDPGLVAISRQASGEMLGLCFTVLAAGLVFAGRAVWAGIFSGLALLSGESVLPGLAVVTLAIGLSGWKGLMPFGKRSESEEDERTSSSIKPGWVRKLALICGSTILLVGTLYLTYPHGLSNWVASIPNYLRGWAEPSGVPASRILAVLVGYQPLGIVFGIIGAVRGWMQSDSLKKGLGWWSAFSFVLLSIYPARQVGDLIWVLVPVLTLAAMEISLYLSPEPGEGYVSLGLAGLIWLLLTLFWLNLLGLKTLQFSNQEFVLRLGAMVGILVLGAITTALIGLGWSWIYASRGLVWGICAAFGFYLLASTFGVLRTQGDSHLELWSQFPIGGDAALLHSTIRELSEWQTGHTESIDILTDVESPSLRWALRNYSRASFMPDFQIDSPQDSPSILITRFSETEPSLAATYRGQDFSWWQQPDWSGALPPDAISWLTFRRAPIRQEQIILWARTDIFPTDVPSDGNEAITFPENDPAGDEVP